MLKVPKENLTDFTKYKLKLVVDSPKPKVKLDTDTPKPKPRARNLYKKQLGRLRRVFR